MDFVFILLGVLIILSFFDVGSFIYKKLGLNHFLVSALLFGLVLLLFIPNIIIENISINIAGFILPLLLAIKLLPKLKSKKRIINFIISLLIITTSVMVYNLIDFSTFNNLVIKPYVYVSLIAGIIIYLICKRTSICYLSLFFGINIGNLLFFQIKYAGEYNAILTLGSREFLDFLILSMLISLICEGVYGHHVKQKKFRYEKKLERLKTIEK